MQLVLRRSRREGWYAFTINARLVLARDEEDILAKYRLRNVILTEGNTRRDMRNAGLLALLATLILYPITAATIGAPLLAAPLIFAAVGFTVYHQIREEVQVNDLLTGRDFKARSFIGLLIKEQMLRKSGAAFALVIEQARTWHEPEVIELQSQPLPAVLEGYREAA